MMVQENKSKFSIVVPVYNEAVSLRGLVDKILSCYEDSELIIVDDGSTDGSMLQIEGLRLKLLVHSKNRGYGAALKTGIENASNDLIVIIDADGTFIAEDIGLLVSNIKNFDLVVGKRKKAFKSRFWRSFGKSMVVGLADLIAGFRIPDVNSGIRVFRRSSVIKSLYLFSDSFSFSTTNTLFFILNNFRILYVPVSNFPPLSKSKVTFLGGIISLKNILRSTLVLRPVRIVIPLLLILTRSLTLFIFIAFLTGLYYGYFLLIMTLFLGLLLAANAITKCRRDLIYEVR